MSAFILDRVMTLSDHSNDPKPHHCHFVNAFEAPTGFAVTPYLHNTVRVEIIFSQPIGLAKKNLRLFIEGVKIRTGPLALVSGCMRACFIHGTPKIQNRKSN